MSLIEMVKAVSYASSANLGPGFDVLGLSLSAFKDEVTLELLNGTSEVRVSMDNWSGNTTDYITPEENTAGLAILKLRDAYGIKDGIHIKIKKGIPVGMGLGSSGASAAAAVTAFDEVYSLKLSLEKKIEFSMIGEIASSGSSHADNVAPAIVGGLVAVISNNPIRFLKLDFNESLRILLLMPKIDIPNKTKRAREILPKEIKMKNHVESSMRLLGLIKSLQDGNLTDLKKYMFDDIVEESRKRIYPFYPKIRDIAERYQDIAIALSGAGPSILVLTKKNSNVYKFMKEVDLQFRKCGMKYDMRWSSLGDGSKVLG